MTDEISFTSIKENSIRLPKSYEDYWTRKFGLTPAQFEAALKAGRLAGLCNTVLKSPQNN
jgi:hypothetical protein